MPSSQSLHILKRLEELRLFQQSLILMSLLVFGTPIVLNPVMMIPFIITPLILGTISWFATTLGLINPVVTLAPWTLPGPIGAYFATGGDWRAALLNVILIVLSFAIYYPFFRIYDNNLLLEEEGKNPEEELATER